ncbi:hypothetical protein FRC0206_00620 [Corynebacterium diphtheriae]|nr:hypothetical protein FRC0205_00466 [Corynebacterium diphtheriae]CAB0790692.1 hypothetical protein FRC0206_00620 [Corynebacterium diphtheriae]
MVRGSTHGGFGRVRDVRGSVGRRERHGANEVGDGDKDERCDGRQHSRGDHRNARLFYSLFGSSGRNFTDSDRRVCFLFIPPIMSMCLHWV